MKNILTLVCMFIGSPIFAEARSFPTIEVNGVFHYLAGYNSATGVNFESGDGYCVRKGHHMMSDESSAPEDVKPLVRLDSRGHVVETFSDYQAGIVWAITNISCR